MYPQAEASTVEENFSFYFTQGFRAALPIVLGYLPLGFAYGVLAREAGFSLWETVLLSVFLYAGSGQFIAVSLFSNGVALAAIIFTVFLVNLRHLLFSASFVPHLRRFKPAVLALLAAEITDETFAVAISHYADHDPRLPYHFGLHLTAHSSWVLASLLGGLAGNLIGDPARFGFNFALPAMFIILLVMQLKDKKTLLVAGLAAVFSVAIALVWPGNWNIILATVLAATLGVILEPWTGKS
ncbi:AzlC family ABC transporter permease [Neomoorella thermoacetica]|uniref:AzlC family ABC transporter permease n=1 Tax=Neomoorella thermoacetica TaxID=1525 RepID=UPI0008FB7016|nr:AzlC family ABC transporter permease [Moorella thermoacetica]APC08408.1 inner membrane protein YgaZ [Moorella thermoacetica]